MSRKSSSRTKRKRQKREQSKKDSSKLKLSAPIVKQNNPFGYKCSPKCPFFPNMDCKSWKEDEQGIKRRMDNKKYICGWDGHLITSWYNSCPKDLEA